MDKIFISVASFMDPFLEFTLKSACESAKSPERLVFGVVDQHHENRRQSLIDLSLLAQIRYTHIHPVESRGVSWARALVQSLYQDEAFYLQIDSHTYFEKDWDAVLLEQFEQAKALSKKPILSVYPFGFEFEDEQPVVKTRISGETTLVLRPKPDEALTEHNPVLHFRAEHVFARKLLPGFHLAGGFIFAQGHFVNEVPYDSRLYFHGEEQNLAVRAYTRGWDIFHPPKIPLYHLYKQPNNDYMTHHWNKQWDEQRDYRWHELKQAATQRLIDLLYANKNLGVFGLGTQRTLADYAEFSGINYQTRTIDRSTYVDRLPDSP